jgi:hypothetical protein
MKKENKKTIEIPFGAKDSELYKFEYTIPEGYEAEIKDGKVIVKKKESEDEKIRKAIIRLLQNGGYMEPQDKEKAFAWLEKQKEQKPAEWSEEDDLMRDAILKTLERVGDYGTIGMQKDWLKSLRPQPHWKPSEKQMKCLVKCVNRAREMYNASANGYDAYPTLSSLLHDLRSL